MILVTLGTHPQPMDRLLQSIDNLAENGLIREEVVVQAAAYGYRPRNAQLFGIESFDWIQESIRRASAIVSHAGPGTLCAIRLEGRVPVVVPRLSGRGEHVDDHQVAYSARLRSRPGYRVVADTLNLTDLRESIEYVSGLRHAPSPPPDLQKAISSLELMLQLK